VCVCAYSCRNHQYSRDCLDIRIFMYMNYVFVCLFFERIIKIIRCYNSFQPSSSPPSSSSSSSSSSLSSSLNGRQVQWVGVDMKPYSLELLEARAAASGLEASVKTWHGKIEEYDGECTIVISLHACGSASDAALELAHRNEAPFAISPCCIGKLNRGPASEWLQSSISKTLSQFKTENLTTTTATATSASTAEQKAAFKMLSGWADANLPPGTSEALRSRRAKQIVELDRLHSKKTPHQGGGVMLITGETMSVSPKRDLLIGPISIAEKLMVGAQNHDSEAS